MQDVHELKKTAAAPQDTRGVTPIFDTAKRQQLMGGARRVFLEHGFNGASVGDIVRAAGVSKGTLYAYFPSKEKLFESMIFEDRRKQAEAICEFDEADENVARVLTKLGTSLMEAMSTPETIAFVRTVIGAVSKFPEVGRVFYEAGPGYGVARLAAYLRRMTDKGLLHISNAECAAQQFLDLCRGGCYAQLMFGYAEGPSPEVIASNVESAVSVFMKVYGTGEMGHRAP
jgi:AcrR family transcriptional regulator